MKDPHNSSEKHNRGKLELIKGPLSVAQVSEIEKKIEELYNLCYIMKTDFARGAFLEKVEECVGKLPEYLQEKYVQRFKEEGYSLNLSHLPIF